MIENFLLSKFRVRSFIFLELVDLGSKIIRSSAFHHDARYFVRLVRYFSAFGVRRILQKVGAGLLKKMEFFDVISIFDFFHNFPIFRFIPIFIPNLPHFHHKSSISRPILPKFSIPPLNSNFLTSASENPLTKTRSAQTRSRAKFPNKFGTCRL